MELLKKLLTVNRNLGAILPSVIGSVVLVVLMTAHAQEGPRYSHTGPTIISGIRVIDGLGNAPKENQDILVANGRIAAIGPSGSLRAPNDALEIDGKGMTALPGLIDMHIHLQGGWANGTIPGEKYEPKFDDASVQQRLSGYVYAGVTTVLDIGNNHKWVLGMRSRINGGELLGPRFFAAGVPWSQAPSGWDAPSGDAPLYGEDHVEAYGQSTKVTTIEAIPGQMDRYQKDGIEIVKLYTGLSPHAAQFVIAEAHKHDILTVADFWGLNLNKMIMQITGLDGWAHSAGFDVVSDEDQKWMADNGRFVIVTANVGEKLAGLRVPDEGGKRLMAKEPLIVDIWGEKAVNEFYEVFPQIRHNLYDGPDAFYQQMGFGDLTRFRANFLKNIKGSYDAGVLIAGGTDDVYPGLWPGESMHRELELLVMAGIPKLEAIKICTYNAARILRREKELGSLQKGLSADILIVEGNPAKNISDSRNVKHVFLHGKQVDRESLKLKK
jgi:imidazolonepropionase-like amidohydrolase